MSRAEVRAQQRTTRAMHRHINEQLQQAKSRKACDCGCHRGVAVQHAEGCLCRRISRGLAR